MANLMISALYGNDYSKLPGIKGIALQFHLTALCDQNCKHCYMHNSPSFRQQLKNAMSKEDIFSLLDQYREFFTEYQCSNVLAITGGDPILSPYFWDVLAYINESYSSDANIVIMGNSYHITPEVAYRLKENNVNSYQISIDGLEEMHDYFRKPGSFKDALRALKVLCNAGIITCAAFTMSKLNAKDFLPLMEFLDELPYVDVFGFDRLISVGNASKLSDEVFTPLEYRQMLFKILKHEITKKTRLVSSKKEKMWRLLCYELGLVDPFDSDTSRILAGCNAGTGQMSVLSDGTIFACRKLEMTAGSFPKQSFKEIFIQNPITEKLRALDKLEGCNTCQLRAYCRGCFSSKFAASGNMYAQDPLCWRN